MNVNIRKIFLFLFVILSIFSLCISLEAFFYYESIIEINAIVNKINILYILVSVLYLFALRYNSFLCPELVLSFFIYMSSFLLIYSDALGFRSVQTATGPLLLRSVALANIGWIFYLYGSFYALKRIYSPKRIKNLSYHRALRTRNFFLGFMIIAFVFFLINDYSFYSNKYSGQVTGQASSVLTYVIILSVLVSYFEFLRLKYLNVSSFIQILSRIDIVYVIILSIISFLLLFVFGDRSSAMQIILPVIFLYHFFISRIKGFYFIAFIIVGISLASFVKYQRAGELDSAKEFYKFNSLAVDFIPANAAIPTLINYVDNNGCANGENVFYPVLSFVPFLQGVVKNVTGYDGAEPSSIVNSKAIGGENFTSGQGTNIIGDLYYSFGFIGVIFGMFIAGYLYSKFFNLVLERYFYNTKEIIVLLFLLGNIVYFVRVEYFYIVRNISFSLIFLYLFNRLFYRKLYERNFNNNPTI